MAGSSASDSRVDLTISIATWNNRDLIGGCLRSIERGLGELAAEIVVVDNASEDGTVEMIRAEFPRVRLIRNDQPRGFSANHNQVLRRAAGRCVLLLNDDTVVVEDALVRAVEFLDKDHRAGAVGCTLVKPDGTPERVSQRFPHPLDPIFPGLRRKVLPTDGSAGFQPVDNRVARADAVEVERLSGACLMVRREVLERVGLLDERFDPIYCEDTDFCYRIKQAGWRIYRLPHARVIHHRGQTARRQFADQPRRLQEAKFRWYRKHRGRAALWLYKGAVVIASLTRLGFTLPQLLLPGRKADAGARVKRYWMQIRAAVGYKG